jgi:tetratricopeptide (TPR) repeat protein
MSVLRWLWNRMGEIHRKGTHVLRRHRRAALLAGLVVVLLSSAGGWYLWLQRPVWAAHEALSRYDFPAALEQLEVRAGRWPADAGVYFLAARTARRLTAYDKAQRYLSAYEHSRTTDKDTALLESLLQRCQTGDLEPSVEQYLRQLVANDHPESALILEAVTRGYMQQLRFHEAKECVHLCLERDPNNGQALVLLGLVCQRLNRYGDALDSYRRLLMLYPEHREGKLRLAECLLAGGDTREATPRYEALARERPDDPAVLLGLAVCRGQTGALQEARELLDRLLAADPRNAAALMERGRLALEMEDPAGAEVWLRKAVALDPSDRRSNHLLYVCLREQGKEEEAAQQQAHSIRVVNDLLRLGKILGEEMTRSPTNVDLHCELGVLYLRNGQEKQGLRWLHSALRLDPTHRGANGALADYYERAGDPVQAAAHRPQAPE